MDGRSNRRNKAAFPLRISVDGRPNRRNKAAFSIIRGSVDKAIKVMVKLVQHAFD